MFTAQPNNLNNTNNKEATKKYLDLCKLEIFLAVYSDYCIGYISVEAAIIVQDLFIHIAQLNHHWINNVKYTADSPNDLFFKFSVILESLPDNA